MKIILITDITPAPENIRGTSALPYHLLVERNSEIDVEIYSFNINNLSEEQIWNTKKDLNAPIHLLPIPHWTRWMFKFHLSFLRVFFKYPYLCYLKLSKEVVADIKSQNPDGIWIYGEEIALLMNQFPEYKRIHVGPDSEALYYYRMLGQRFVVNDWKMYLRQAVMYPKYLRLERRYLSDDNAVYCVVGEADAEFIRCMNPPCKTVFLRHPHYDVLRPTKDVIHFHQPVRLLVAGRYDLYMRQSADELMEAFCRCKDNYLKASYEITFLGKGWNMHAERLRQSGWKVRQITFAPNYAEEVMRHDIQLSPITVGTGTKGKVLDALANGLLVVGTLYAMENVAVKNGQSCVVYQRAAEVVELLTDILSRLSFYEQMAEKGRQSVLSTHDRKLLAHDLFDLFR